MKKDQCWINTETGLWDVTYPEHIVLISFGLWVEVIYLDASKVILSGRLPKAGPYLHSLKEGHAFHITWSECGPPDDYYGNEAVTVSLTGCDVTRWWVEDFVIADPGNASIVCLNVELSCDTVFFFDGEGEHVR